MVSLANFQFAYFPLWLAAAVVFGFWNGWVWRPGGAAHKWRAYILRRFPKKPKQAK